MSDLKHKTPAELRAEITSISRWRASKEREATEKEAQAASLLVEASQLRQRAHNMGQCEAWSRIYLAEKT